MDNYYHILGLKNNASTDEIKKAYRQLAKKYHPDKDPSKEEAFKRISNAYKHLTDPILKERFDASLRPPTSPKYNSGRRNYTNRTTFYTSEKPYYTSRMRLYGTLLSIGFVLTMILLAMGLMYKASNYSYNEGLTLVTDKKPRQALQKFDDAISFFGERSGEASIAASRLLLNINPQSALKFVNKGLKNTFKEQYLAELHFLKAKALKFNHQFKEAQVEFNTSDEMGYLKDSVMLQLGLLNAFQLKDYENGLSNFEYILQSDQTNSTGLFGKAWCLQKLNKHQKAIEEFNQLLKFDDKNAIGYYYRGQSEIILGDTLGACSDFEKAHQFGYILAEQIVLKYCNQD